MFAHVEGAHAEAIPRQDQTLPAAIPQGDGELAVEVAKDLGAVLFVLFDLEAVFMYPWAVSLSLLGTGALIEMFVFVAVLLVGFVYAWKKGVFEWE